MISQTIKSFSEKFDQILHNQLSEYLIQTLSNMLAFDYHSRKTNIHEEVYSKQCAIKLKDYLMDQVLLDEDFCTALKLFIIIISPDDVYSEDITNLMHKNRDLIIDQTTKYFFKDNGELNMMLKSTLLQNNMERKIRYISDNPLQMLKILNKYQDNKLSLNSINDIVDELAYKSEQETLKKKNLNQAISLAVSSIVTVGLIGISTMLGAVAAVSSVPAVLVGLKYGIDVGKINDISENNVKYYSDILDKPMSIDKNKSQGLDQAKKLSKTQGIQLNMDTIEDIKGIVNNQFKDVQIGGKDNDLAAHKSMQKSSLEETIKSIKEDKKTTAVEKVKVSKESKQFKKSI